MREDSLGLFGDSRRALVGSRLFGAMQRKRTMCLHRLAENRAEARQFGEFLASGHVCSQEMVTYAGQQTGKRVAGRHILALNDTTELHFATHVASKRGFGAGGNGVDPGLFLHPLLAVDADDGGIIGLADCIVINRVAGKVTPRHQRAADAKESRRWLDCANAAGDVLREAAMITTVGDRESDIHALFAERPANVHVLCRAMHDRVLTDGTKLSLLCGAWTDQACVTIDVPVRGTRPARQATVGVRFGELTLRPPAQAKKTRPIGAAAGGAAITLWCVDVREHQPPAGQQPVHWRLLTTHRVETIEQAHQIVAWYRRRWTIEQVFRSLKSHCLRIEESQMEQAACFTKLAIVALIAAVRAMQLVMARDGRTDQPITDAVDPADMPALQSLSTSLEGRTEKLKNPYDPATLAWFCWIVARLGGWSGYTSRGYKPPGPKTMHHGLLRLDAILTGWKLANRSALLGLP